MKINGQSINIGDYLIEDDSVFHITKIFSDYIYTDRIIEKKTYSYKQNFPIPFLNIQKGLKDRSMEVVKEKHIKKWLKLKKL